MTVRAWLTELGLERYADAFEENDVDTDVLAELDDADLVTLGVRSLGHRKRLLAAIRRGPPTVAAPLVPGPAEPIERGLVEALAARGYRMAEKIGQGGMGTVYRARQASVDREVAIKLLRPSTEDGASERFAREARAIAALTHPHSVRLYDFVETAEGAAIVMEHVEGEALSDLLRREGRLPFARAAAILVQVLDALTEAHAKGIVHRDLKPSNVLLQSAHGHGDFARVLDFGLARWVSVEESRLTRTGAVCGTPRYLSPEQIRGEEVTLQSDLYALGVILYEALAGATPFRSDLDAALLVQHLSRPAPALPADVERPEACDDLLSRLLAKAPTLRPASAHAVRRELAALLPREAGSVRRGSSSTTSTVTRAAPERRRVVAVDLELGPTARGSDEAEHARLARARAELAAVRERYEGFLTNVEPTRQTWVFGAPVAHRDDARRALAAALGVQHVLRSIDGTRVRLGVAAGAAIGGGSGAPGDRFFVVGEPLERARALREAAGDLEIRVEEGLLDPELHAFEPTEAPGVVRLTGRRRGPSTSTISLPFVGRARELGEIEDAYRRCRRSGTGRILVVAGEAGMGKSRLVEHAWRRLTATGVRTARAQVLDFDVGEDVLRQLVRHLLSIAPGEPDVEAALERRLGPEALGPSQWPFLFHFLGVPLSRAMERVYDAMEPTARRAGYRDMLAALLASETARAPIALVVEDMHWADAAALDAVETLSGLTRSLPVLLVLTTRVEGEEGWRSSLAGQTVTRLELAALADDDADALASALGGDEHRRREAVARAAGHPLFLTEMLREDAGELPPSIQGLIHSRLDRLPETDRAAAQLAAVLGAQAPLAQLRALLDDESYDPRRLAEYRLVERDGDRLRFTHALVRDAVYGSLVDDRRRALHARCAALVADVPAARAAHLERAGRAHEAADAHLEAATLALGADRYEEAKRHALRAVALAEPGGAADRGALRLLGRVELVLGDAAASRGAFEALEERAGGDADRLEAAVGRAEALFIETRYEEALAALDRADELARDGDPGAGRASYVRGRVAFATGRPDACHEAHARALAIARAHDDAELAARASSGMADALYAVGRLASASRAYEECVESARRAGLLGVLAVNEPLASIAGVFMLELARSRALGEAALARGRELAHRRGETLAHGALSLVAFHAGDAASGLVHAEHAAALGRATGTTVFEANGHYYAARSAIELGDPELARHHAEQGLSLARGGAMRFLGGALLATLARLAEDPAEAAARLAEGAAVLEGPCLSFNRLWFHENAIEHALSVGDADAARRHADAIEAFVAPEPFPWATLIVARARALADDDDAAVASVLAAMSAAGLVLGRGDVERALGV